MEVGHAHQDRTVLETLNLTIDEIATPTLSGDTHTYLTCKFPILDTQGDLIALGWMDTDITDLKLAEDKLIVAKHEAERANLSKSKFLMAGSHDLRQPLYALNLFFDTLAATGTVRSTGLASQEMESTY